jgi:acetylornithine deacetylase/succinyl-diaminopimelate desuccinylase-like protein
MDARTRLAVTIDAIGNIVGVRGGREEVPPVMFGSHVDTVATGGRYDGLDGVLAGLEACEAANDASAATRRPLALVAFTNEEGSRFRPYAGSPSKLRRCFERSTKESGARPRGEVVCLRDPRTRRTIDETGYRLWLSARPSMSS